MKKVMKVVASILGGVFAMLVFGLMISLTFGALARLFPASPINQAWGLVLFDIAALVWFVAFLYSSEGAGQRAVALVLFVASLVGTVAMVSSEVLMSGQGLVDVPASVARVVVWGFILATVVHLVGVYAHHALAPSVLLSIQTQNLKDDLGAQAVVDAEGRFSARRGELGRVLADRIERDVLAELDLPIPPRLAEELFGVPVAGGDASPPEAGAVVSE